MARLAIFLLLVVVVEAIMCIGLSGMVASCNGNSLRLQYYKKLINHHPGFGITEVPAAGNINSEEESSSSETATGTGFNDNVASSNVPYEEDNNVDSDDSSMMSYDGSVALSDLGYGSDIEDLTYSNFREVDLVGGTDTSLLLADSSSDDDGEEEEE